MPILDEIHDFKHPVEDDSAWSESYYFNAFDPSNDIGMFTRIGIRPNEGSMDVDLAVWLPGNELARFRAFQPQTEMIDSLLEIGGVRYECLSPMKEWIVSASGEAMAFDLADLKIQRKVHIDIDLRFHALIPAIGTDGQARQGKGVSSETGKNVGKGHLEQSGRWSGWIEADGKRYTLTNARGNRDKSWGPRRWEGPRMWRWFSINIDDETHFGGIRIGTNVGDLHRGWVWRDGKSSSIKNWDVRTQLAADGMIHRVSLVNATDKEGRLHELRGDVLRVFPVIDEPGPNGRILYEGLASWTYEGRTGYGISEYLHQLDDQGKPVVPIE